MRLMLLIQTNAHEQSNPEGHQHSSEESPNALLEEMCCKSLLEEEGLGFHSIKSLTVKYMFLGQLCQLSTLKSIKV